MMGSAGVSPASASRYALDDGGGRFCAHEKLLVAPTEVNVHPPRFSLAVVRVLSILPQVSSCHTRTEIPKMAGEGDLQHLLEVILDTGKSPEEVCQGDPELLAQVRARLQYVRLLEAKLDVLLPSSSGQDAGTAVPRPWTAQPPHLSGYEVQDELGRGGMGVVYRAWDQRLHRPVAIKMLLAGDFARPDERERFEREAEAAAGLRHANIVQVYQVGDHDGRPYFTMEFIEGGSLAERLAGAPLAAGAAAALIATLAEAVQAAHHRGIVHRDLKPGNVLLTADGTPKIADFGLARRLDDRAGLTRSGIPLGTPNYMAPEQALGLTHAIGPAADVYALGAILYEALTGRPPFRADTTAETLRQVVEQEPTPPSRWNAKVPRDLEVICLKCLRKEPHRRYPSAAALAEDLRRFERGESITARPSGPLGTVRPVARAPEGPGRVTLARRRAWGSRWSAAVSG